VDRAFLMLEALYLVDHSAYLHCYYWFNL